MTFKSQGKKDKKYPQKQNTINIPLREVLLYTLTENADLVALQRVLNVLKDGPTETKVCMDAQRLHTVLGLCRATQYIGEQL